MPEKKDSNPKDALGVKKVPFHTIPTKPLLEVGLAMMEGGRKYGAHNYRQIGVCMSTYYDAAMRHLTAWWEGEDIDPDSGIHHVIKAIASLFVVRDSMHMGNCVDDRPIQYPNGINIGEFNKLAAELITKYPKCAEPFTWHTNDYNALEIDGPRVFQSGDIVSIHLRSSANVGIKGFCADNANKGVYSKSTGVNNENHWVDVGGNQKWFYGDEISPVKDN